MKKLFILLSLSLTFFIACNNNKKESPTTSEEDSKQDKDQDAQNTTVQHGQSIIGKWAVVKLRYMEGTEMEYTGKASFEFGKDSTYTSCDASMDPPCEKGSYFYDAKNGKLSLFPEKDEKKRDRNTSSSNKKEVLYHISWDGKDMLIEDDSEYAEMKFVLRQF